MRTVLAALAFLVIAPVLIVAAYLAFNFVLAGLIPASWRTPIMLVACAGCVWVAFRIAHRFDRTGRLNGLGGVLVFVIALCAGFGLLYLALFIFALPLTSVGDTSGYQYWLDVGFRSAATVVLVAAIAGGISVGRR